MSSSDVDNVGNSKIMNIIDLINNVSSAPDKEEFIKSYVETNNLITNVDNVLNIENTEFVEYSIQQLFKLLEEIDDDTENMTVKQFKRLNDIVKTIENKLIVEEQKITYI